MQSDAPKGAARRHSAASALTLLVAVLLAGLLSECISDGGSPANLTDCGVFSGSPCAAGTLVPQSGNGCLGTACRNGQVCGGTDVVPQSFSCQANPLPCGYEVFTTVCATNADCVGNATCSSGICYGTACPSGEVCSGLFLTSTCVPGDGGVVDAGAEASVDTGGTEAGAVDAALDSASSAAFDGASPGIEAGDADAAADGNTVAEAGGADAAVESGSSADAAVETEASSEGGAVDAGDGSAVADAAADSGLGD